VVNNYKIADKFRYTNWPKEGQKEEPYGATAEMVFRLLTVPMEYITFSSTNPFSTKKNKYKSATEEEKKAKKENQSVDQDLNLEYIHNYVHGCTGGEGHMANVPVAAFDPLFWMHHWQVLILLCSSIALVDH
jgi:hypothetical protein